MYTIYKHIFPNGKVYVGCTSRNPETRWQNGYGYTRNKKMFEDIILYGWQNIQHRIIAQTSSKALAFKIEEHFIKKLQSYDGQYGYNISKGFGKTGCEQKHNLETRIKISRSRKGKLAKENHPSARAVFCVELNKVFPYAKLAEEITGVDRSHICQVCKGQRYTAGKMHWRYADS